MKKRKLAPMTDQEHQLHSRGVDIPVKYATSSVDSTSVKNTAALAVRNARDMMKKEEIDEIKKK